MNPKPGGGHHELSYKVRVGTNPTFGDLKTSVTAPIY